MLAQRITHQSARRLIAHQPTTLSRFVTPAAIATNRSRLQARGVAFQPSSTEPQGSTTPAKPSDEYAILAAQRRLRPVAPHLSIYQAQIPWYLSGLNRITACILSGSLYVFATAYLASPLFGWHLESVSMAEWFGSFSGLSKGLMKGVVSLPFTYHSLNGIRHLVWDSGRQFGNRQVQVTGYIVIGLTVVSSVGLAFVGGS